MAGEHFYQFGSFRLDVTGRLLFRQGKMIPLAPKVAHTLLLLLENAGKLVDKEDLLKRVWPDAFIEEGSLTRTISVLRKTLGNKAEEYIVTVPKRGYRFVAPVKEVLNELLSPKLEKTMLVVLPFEDFSADKQQEYFSDGLTE